MALLCSTFSPEDFLHGMPTPEPSGAESTPVLVAPREHPRTPVPVRASSACGECANAALVKRLRKENDRLRAELRRLKQKK